MYFPESLNPVHSNANGMPQQLPSPQLGELKERRNLVEENLNTVNRLGNESQFTYDSASEHHALNKGKNKYQELHGVQIQIQDDDLDTGHRPGSNCTPETDPTFVTANLQPQLLMWCRYPDKLP